MLIARALVRKLRLPWLTLGWALLIATNASGSEGKAAIDIDLPGNCAACHAAVVEEWQQSMHSRAHHDNDPIYGGMRAVRMKKQGPQIAGKCAQCHNPRSPADTTTAAAHAGVSCATCHNLASVHRGGKRKGAKALEYRADDRLASGRDRSAGASPAHPTGQGVAELRDGETVCLACHDATQTPGQAPACTTGPEYSQRHDTSKTCVSCHMPEIDGPVGAFGRQDAHRSHVFLGPHRAWYQNDPTILQQAVALTMQISGAELQVSLQNLSAHAFPSGFPGRLAILRLNGTDADGSIVWHNFTKNPMVDDPQAVFNKVYVNAEGNVVPAPFSTQLRRDNRLRSDETRQLRYTLPANVVSVRAELEYRLLPDKLATFVGLSADAIEREGRVIAQATAQR